MHMSDALLSPAVGTTLWAGSLGTITYCAGKLKQDIDEKIIPLMGIMGAFIFAAQMINFTIPGTGSSGHIGGGMILAVLLGPHAGFVTIASVLIVQSLFFADGGILALGCNIWNLGVYPCFIAYPLFFRTVVRNDFSMKRITAASVLSVAAALQLGAFSVVIETLLSGRTDLPFGTFTAMMLPIHLAIGLVEGLITAGIINYVRSARPEILRRVYEPGPHASGMSMKRLLITLGAAALITGGALSWFASTHPDGLEWSIERVLEKPYTAEPGDGIIPVLEKIQDNTAVLPDYDFRSDGEEEKNAGDRQWPAMDKGTSVSGVLGSLMVLGIVLLVGFGIRSARRYQKVNRRHL